MDLAGKVALVTGGAQRVGRVLCLALAEAGADIVVNHWRTPDDAATLRDAIEELGRRCLVVECDITDVEASGAMIDKVEEEFGRLDVLVHNASNFNLSPFLDVTEDVWESSIGVNLKAPFFLSQAAARLMLKNGSGRMMALVGNSYFENWPDAVPHVVAKTGLAKLMQSLAVALSPTIQCNAICPARILPSAEGQDEQVMEARGELVPEKEETTFYREGDVVLREGTPEDVAELVVYLAGCSGYMTGGVIPIDGAKHAL
jgi:NAD(P)-dependent dehydrogenase (short-subunit alcohol dehydrogenase family)